MILSKIIEKEETATKINNYLIVAAIRAARREGCICYREQGIIDNFGHIELETHGKIKVANIYDKNGDGFQIVINDSETQKIGSVTN